NGGLVPRDYEADPLYSFAAPLPMQLIPRDEWRERIEEMDRTKTRLSDMVRALQIPVKHQAQTKYCWIFSAVTALEVSRAVQGEPFVSLSPASAGALIKGYR